MHEEIRLPHTADDAAGELADVQRRLAEESARTGLTGAALLNHIVRMGRSTRTAIWDLDFPPSSTRQGPEDREDGR